MQKKKKKCNNHVITKTNPHFKHSITLACSHRQNIIRSRKLNKTELKKLGKKKKRKLGKKVAKPQPLMDT